MAAVNLLRRGIGLNPLVANFACSLLIQLTKHLYSVVFFLENFPLTPARNCANILIVSNYYLVLAHKTTRLNAEIYRER